MLKESRVRKLPSKGCCRIEFNHAEWGGRHFSLVLGYRLLFPYMFSYGSECVFVGGGLWKMPCHHGSWFILGLILCYLYWLLWGLLSNIATIELFGNFRSPFVYLDKRKKIHREKSHKTVTIDKTVTRKNHGYKHIINNK